jgi:hypothetical protein
MPPFESDSVFVRPLMPERDHRLVGNDICPGTGPAISLAAFLSGLASDTRVSRRRELSTREQ